MVVRYEQAGDRGFFSEVLRSELTLGDADEEDAPDPLAAATAVAMAGMDPMRYLESTDQIESLVMAALADKHRKEEERRDKNRATEISNAVFRAIGQ